MSRIPMSYDLFLTRVTPYRPPGKSLLNAALVRLFDRTDWRSLINEWHFEHAGAETSDETASRKIVLSLLGDRFHVACLPIDYGRELFALVEGNPLEQTIAGWTAHAKIALLNEVADMLWTDALADRDFAEDLRLAVLSECHDMQHSDKPHDRSSGRRPKKAPKVMPQGGRDARPLH